MFLVPPASHTTSFTRLPLRHPPPSGSSHPAYFPWAMSGLLPATSGDNKRSRAACGSLHGGEWRRCGPASLPCHGVRI